MYFPFFVKITLCAVVQGFTFMVDYHLAHPFLQTVLPQLCKLIHDKVERVRIAIVDLLLKVKTLRAIKVSHVLYDNITNFTYHMQISYSVYLLKI